MTTIRTNEIERRHLPQPAAGIELRMAEQDQGQPGELHGYGAVFFDPVDPDGTQFELVPGLVERIMPGAFDQSLSEDDVRCLFNHRADNVLGRKSAGTLQLQLDGRGLLFRCQMPDTTCGRDVAVSVQRRDVTGSSVGMIVLDRVLREDGDTVYREVTRAKILDVGPVTWPAYQATSTEVAQRSLDAYRAEKRAGQYRARRLRLLQLRNARAI